MGLLVPEVVLSTGETVSNVYISMHNHVVTIQPKEDDQYKIHTWAIITRTPGEFPYLEAIELVVSDVDLSKGPFTTVYASLKAMYPTAVDYSPEE